MKVGYVRVSTVEQNEARQIEGLQNFKLTTAGGMNNISSIQFHPATCFP